MTIGEVSEKTGLSVHALRFYEREGLLFNPVRRDASGRRMYDQDTLEWLEVCVILRASGMPVDDVRRYTELVRAGRGNEKERLELLRRHQERVLAQKATLDKGLDIIKYKVGVYEDILDGVVEG